tara:strand:- start:1513 stop:1980 length:468 start_codon:yes stop_codon:yes gene_type:complete
LTNISTKEGHVGARGERLFANYFVDKGILVAKPEYDLHRCDFIVEWNDQLVRVNVKTLHRRGARGRKGEFSCSTATSCGRGSRLYRPDEIDYFGVVSLDYGYIWMIPLSATKGFDLTWHSPEKQHRKRANSFNWDPYLINPDSKSVFQPELVKLS